MSKHLLEKAKEYAMYAILFSLPIFYVVNTTDMRQAQERYFQAAGMVLGSLFFGNIWLTLFFVLNMILFVYHGAEIGGSQTLSIFLTCILFACSRNFFSQKEQDFFKYAKALYFVAALSIFWMCLQLFGIDPLNTGRFADGVLMRNATFNVPCGLLAGPAFNGIFLTLVAALLMFQGSVLIGFLLFIPVFMMKSSASALAFAFLIVFWAYHRFREFIFFIPIPKWRVIGIKFNYLWVIGAMLLSFGAYTFHDNKVDPLTYGSRLETWHLIFKQSLANPFGWGPDSFRNYNSHKNFMFYGDETYNPMLRSKIDANTDRLQYYSADAGNLLPRYEGKKPKNMSEWREAHNEYLQFFFEYGIFGLIIFGGLIREVWDRYILSSKDNVTLALFACLLVYAITSITQFPFHLARLTGMFGIILGAYFAATDKNYKLFRGEI